MPNDQNIITDELIAEATGGFSTGTVAIGGGSQPLWWRKPVFRKGHWCVRNSGWSMLRSWRRAGSCLFFSTEWHFYGFSKEMQNVGALPAWYDHNLMRTSCHLYRPGTHRNRALWADVETYHIQARYETDIPEEFRFEEPTKQFA